MRTVQRKYQILITHQTLDLKKLGQGGAEDNMCEAWRKYKYFDVVVNDDSTFQSHCLRCRDELLFPSPPTKDKSGDSKKPVSWSLDGIRSPPFPKNSPENPHYTCPCVADKGWKETLNKNLETQFGLLAKFGKNKDRNFQLPAGALVRINPNGAGGVKQLMKFATGGGGGGEVAGGEG
eukprot:gene13541-6045_t